MDNAETWVHKQEDWHGGIIDHWERADGSGYLGIGDVAAELNQSRAAVNALRDQLDVAEHALKVIKGSWPIGPAYEAMQALEKMHALSPAQAATPPEYGLAQSIYAQENEEDD